MITQLSRRISSFFVDNNIIQSEDKGVYSYSVEVLLASIFNLLAVVIIAILSKRFIETVFFLFGFLPLRAVAGGYHAKTQLRCFLLLMFTYALFLLIIFRMPTLWFTALAIASFGISGILVFLLSPIEDSNKPLSQEEKVSFKRKSRLSIAVYCLIIFSLLLTLPNTAVGLSLSLGMCSVAISLLASKIKTLMPHRVLK